MEKIGNLAIEIPGDPYLWRNGLVYYKNTVVVPPNSQIIKQLLREFHDSQIGGHLGVLRTYKGLHNNSIGHQCFEQCKTMSLLMMYVNELNMKL